MDCRKRMFWSLALLGGMAGCTTTGTNTPPSTTPTATPTATPVIAPVATPAQAAKVDPAQVKKEHDLPKKDPTPKMCVVFGDFVAGEADACASPVEANDKRDQARKAYQQALRLDPKYVPAYQGLAKLYLAMQDTEHAVATLQTALKQHPKDAAVYFDLGMIYCNRKEWAPALENLGKAAQLEPENRLYVNTLGHAQARAGKPDEALKTYLRVNPEAKAYLNLARMMQHLNQPEASRQYLQVALQKDPKVPGAHELLVQLYGTDPTEVRQTSGSELQAGSVAPIQRQ
jgi:Tfp pilus assembly protein PilF